MEKGFRWSSIAQLLCKKGYFVHSSDLQLLFEDTIHSEARISGEHWRLCPICTLSEDLVPCFHTSLFVVVCVNMFLHQCHQVQLPQLLYLKIKVILILAAECGRLPSPQVHSFSHSLVISEFPTSEFAILFFIFLINIFNYCFEFHSVIIITFSLFQFL